MRLGTWAMTSLGILSPADTERYTNDQTPRQRWLPAPLFTQNLKHPARHGGIAEGCF